MSSDIYIPLAVVLSHPGQFELKAALNGCAHAAYSELGENVVDWEYIKDQITPVLLCKFGARDTWRVVEVVGEQMHVSCAGDFRMWLYKWLNELGHPCSTLDDPTRRCYQCDKEALWLAPDGRCSACTRTTPDELKGEV